MSKREVTNQRAIVSYIHCGLCIREFQEGDPGTAGQSPATYSQLEVGWTEFGLQVWCRRHDCNVVHIDFEGQKHPANQTRRKRSPDDTYQCPPSCGCDCGQPHGFVIRTDGQEFIKQTGPLSFEVVDSVDQATVWEDRHQCNTWRVAMLPRTQKSGVRATSTVARRDCK